MENVVKSFALSLAEEIQRVLDKVERNSPMEDMLDTRDTPQNDCTNPQEFESVGLGQSPNFQIAEADDKSSIIQGRLMVDWIPADRLGQALVYVQKSAGLRSLEEIADEIGLLLTLTAEQDSDSLALKKLKRALTRKQLIQVQAEVATLHKAVREAMGDSVWRWDF